MDTSKIIEDGGFNSIWVYDHMVTYPNPSHDPCLECWSTLSYLASITNKIRLGPLVTCNSYRYPTLLAKIASTLDVLSGGRLEFGIGAGWYELEYSMYGIPFPKPKVRIDMLREALEIIKGMWSNSKISFQGEHYIIKDVLCYPKPSQKPHPPILIGGAGEKLLLRLVAEKADMCNFGSLTPEEYQAKIKVLEEHCRKVGRSSNEIKKSLRADVLITQNRSEAIKEAKKANLIHRPQWELEEFISRCFVGTPKECIDKFQKFIDIGVTDFMLYFQDVVEYNSLQLFSKEVIPSF